MKINPVRPFRLSIVLLVPVVPLLILITVHLANANLIETHSKTGYANESQLNDDPSPYKFIKTDRLLIDADQDGFVTAADTVQYTLTFSNTSENDLSQLQITDTVDLHSTYVDGSMIVSPLAFADTFTTTINTNLNAPAPGILANDKLFGSETNISAFTKATTAGGTVTVYENGRFTYTPPTNFVGKDNFSYTLENEAGKDSATATIMVVDSDLGVHKVVDNGIPFAGELISYTIKARNEGATQLTNIIISDTLPIGVSYVDHAAPDDTTYNPATGSWHIPQLNSSADATFQIIARVEMGTARQTITNTAVLASMDQVDSNPHNNQHSASVTVQPLVDIALQKIVDNSTPVAGDTIVYTISATNNGPDEATGVEVTDILPTGVTYLTSDQPTFTPPIWAIGDLSSGQSETLNITTTVNSLTAGNSYTNTATVTTVNETDANNENNSDYATIAVLALPHAIDDTPQSSSPVSYHVLRDGTLNTAVTSAPSVLGNDDLGIPTAAVSTFGYPNGDEQTVGTGTTTTEHGGTIEILANGDFIYLPANGFYGHDHFFYTIQNSAGQSVAEVEINVQAAPTAKDDPQNGIPENSTPPSGAHPHPYHFATNSTNNVISIANGLLANDTLGNPNATIVSFGGGDIGGSVTTNLAGTTAISGTHQLRVNASGRIIYTPHTDFKGYFTFAYRLENSVGFDDSTVTIAVGERPFIPIEPAVCQDDSSYTATGNMGIQHNATTGVLANDSGPDIVVTAVQGGAVGVPRNTERTGLHGVAGSVTMQTNGRFRYDPPPGFTGTDTFTYTINNEASEAQTCTVTITISNIVWFIDNNAAGNNLGTLQNPFTSLTAFNNVNLGGSHQPQNDDLIYLMQGAVYAEDGVTLRNGQDLIGQAINLEHIITPDADSRDLPIPSGSARTPMITAVSNNGINLATGNIVRGVNIGNTPTGYALLGSSVGNLTINDVEILGTGGAIQISTNGTLDAQLESLASTRSIGSAIDLHNVNGTMLVEGSGNHIENTNAGSPAINIAGGTVNLTYSGQINKNNEGALLQVQNEHSGTLTFNNGTLNATFGLGLQFNNADGEYNFNGPTLLHGGEAGIDIVSNSEGAFSFSNITITDPSGTAFNLFSSSADILFSGTIDDDDNTAVYINNNDNGSVTFQSGTINSPDRGITIINSNNSTFNFSSAIDLNTASDDALALNNNDNSTITFSDSINIQTTTGIGFKVTGGGTVNVTASNNSIVTTNRGTAVEISNTTIGSDNITFQNITTDKAVNGILLNNTGSEGTFIVAGGTIQNSTGDGIYLENTNAILNQIDVLSSAGNGILVQLTGDNAMDIALNNNTIQDSHVEGVLVNVGAEAADNGRLDLTMDGNVVQQPVDPSTSGIYGTAIQAQGETTICANISDNQSIGANGAQDFRLAQSESSSFFLQGFSTDVTTTILNRGNSRTGGGTATVNTAGEPFAGAQNCGQAVADEEVRDTAVSPQTEQFFDIDHTIHNLPAGKSVTILFNVQLDSAFPNSKPQMSNQAFASAIGMPILLSDDPTTSAPNDPTMTSVKTIKFTYLPSILNNYTALPDLIVESIVVTNNDLTIVLKNSGKNAVTQPFWVDAYFNPHTPPTAANQTIQTLNSEGMVWGIDASALPLAPNETLTITNNSIYYDPINSNFNGAIPAGTLYVQVDSANTNTWYGAIYELDEATPLTYNNISSATVIQTVRFPQDTRGDSIHFNDELFGKRP